MRISPYKGIGGTVLGAILVLGGGILIAFPRAGVFVHPAFGGPFLESVSEAGSRVYGLIAVLFGAGLIWLARWPRWGARRSAIEDFVCSLSQDLASRFGPKQHYRIDEVTRVAAESGCQSAYIAYAHAMFCSRSDFDAYYGPLRAACTYDGLRRVIARRYFNGACGFDAAAVVRLARPPNGEEYDFHQKAAD